MHWEAPSHGPLVLRISRYSDFLLAVLINTGIFLRGSKLCGGVERTPFLPITSSDAIPLSYRRLVGLS